MDKLPLEITEDILCIRVFPTASKALQLHCREVCKTWRDLIPKSKMGLLYGVSHHKATEFEAEFYFSEQNNDKVGMNHADEQLHCIRTLTFDQSSDMPSFRTSVESFIVGSCNGLVCYAGLIYQGLYVQISIYICNPVTGEHIQLPASKHTFRKEPYQPAIGFGYDSSSKEYKVVILPDSNYRGVQMYSLLQRGPGHGWRYKDYLSDNYRLSTLIVQPATGVHIGGALYWINQQKYALKPKTKIVVAFDLEYEMFELLPPVPSVDRDADHVGLMALGENLCFLEVVLSKGIMIWELTYEKTFKYFLKNTKVVKRPQERRACIPVWVMKLSMALENCSWFEPFALRKDEKCYLWHNAVLSCYDPAEPNTLRKLDETLKKFIGGSTPSLYTTNQATPHVNSLVSLIAIISKTGERKIKSL